METWLTKAITFNPSVISESDRSIRGIATAPIFDRENELITRAAIEKALPYYMEIPTLTVNHTERPVGIVTKAEFDDKDRLVIEARIGMSPACDDVWNLVKSGVLNSFSIAGRRRESTCNGNGQACVTKSLWLDSITICEIPCNPEANFIVKSDTMTEEIKQEEVVKSEPTVNEHDAELINMMKSMGESLSQLSAKVETLTKSTEPDVEKKDDKDDKKEEETMREDNVKKSIEDLTEVVKSLEARLVKLEETPINKAVVTITEDGTVSEPKTTNLGVSYAKYLYGSKA